MDERCVNPRYRYMLMKYTELDPYSLFHIDVAIRVGSWGTSHNRVH